MPWQVVAPVLVRMKNLLALETSRSGAGCAAAFKAYVLQNVTTPYMGALSQGAWAGFRCGSLTSCQGCFCCCTVLHGFAQARLMWRVM